MIQRKKKVGTALARLCPPYETYFSGSSTET